MDKKDGNDFNLNGYRLLIMDGHISHINFEFVQFCEDYRIIPICFLLHTTHLLQFFYLVIFSLLKRAYLQKVDEFIALGVTGLNKEWFFRIIGEIWLEIYTADHINSTFEAAGLYPYNPECAFSCCKKKAIMFKALHLYLQTNQHYYYPLPYIYKLQQMPMTALDI